MAAQNPTAPSPVAITTLQRNQFTYTSCYCEENVYTAIKQLQGKLPGSGCAVFVSNTSKQVQLRLPYKGRGSYGLTLAIYLLCCVQVPFWCQKSARHAGMPVVWDYHVFFIWQPDDSSTTWVLDLDTTLPFPCPISDYLTSALKPGHEIFREYPNLRRRFRVVTAAQYLANFSSDRSHMLVGGQYSATPPSYPCIRSSQSDNNLQVYLDMNLISESSDGALHSAELSGPFGAVLSEETFIGLALSNKLVLNKLNTWC